MKAEQQLSDRLILQSKLGFGAFACVLKATLDSKDVAVKVLLPQHANAADDAKPLDPAKLLRREGQALMRHPHKYIAKCLAVLELPPDFPGLPRGYSRSAPALVLELMEEGSLLSLLQRQQLAPWKPMYGPSTAVNWAIQLAEALAHLHGRNVMHRDIKIENVMLAREAVEGGRSGWRRVAKLVDLGLHSTPTTLPRSQSQQLFRAASSSGLDALGSSVHGGADRSPDGSGHPAMTPTAARAGRRHVSLSGAGSPRLDAPASGELCGGDRSSCHEISGHGLAGAGAGGSAAAALAAAVASGPLFFARQAGSSRLLTVDPRGAMRLDQPLPPLMRARSSPGNELASPGSAAASPVLAEPVWWSGAGLGAGGDGGMGGAACVSITLDPEPAPLPAGAKRGKADAARFLPLPPPLPSPPSPSPSLQPPPAPPLPLPPTALQRQLMSVERVEEAFPATRSAFQAAPASSSASAAAPAPVQAPAAQATPSHAGAASTPLGVVLDTRASSLHQGTEKSCGGAGVMFSESSACGGFTASTATSRLGVWSTSELGVPTCNNTLSVGLSLVSMMSVPSLKRNSSSRRSGCGAMSEGDMMPSVFGASSLRRAASPAPLGCEDLLTYALTEEADEAESLDQEDAKEDVAGEAPLLPAEELSLKGQATSSGSSTKVTATSAAEAPATIPEATSAEMPVEAVAKRHSCPSGLDYTPELAQASSSAPPTTPVLCLGEGGAGSAPFPLVQSLSDMGSQTLLPTIGVPSSATAANSGQAGGSRATSATWSGVHFEPSFRPARLEVASSHGASHGAEHQHQQHLAQQHSGAQAHAARSPFVFHTANAFARCDDATTAGEEMDYVMPLESELPYDMQYEAVYRLTGETGSNMTMSPEVLRKLPYNEKADVFSFGVVMFELFSRTLLVCSHIGTKRPDLPRVLHRCEEYAELVADGYRPARVDCIPEHVWDLINDCWQQDPVRRPSMPAVLQRLRLIAQALHADEVAKSGSSKSGAKGAGSRAGSIRHDDDGCTGNAACSGCSIC
ncbi:hypothetical protein HYH03_019219 [Edaphochlamys debaryana]|uniref:Protein kinase domain-containing protein n=1 Tax=Edaphochlamys debaryana TaxID=47281 RepID=A0A835XEF0_9CHLO|nr:hypothetical protein HYH03_019219 [Edaphochlamys debaryana]|eukprot:KAG2481814.1 hypothetical protein HYH03_019219 [Edaphochlamys debaryana]